MVKVDGSNVLTSNTTFCCFFFVLLFLLCDVATVDLTRRVKLLTFYNSYY